MKKLLLVAGGILAVALVSLAQLDSLELVIEGVPADGTNTVTKTIYEPLYLEGVFINLSGVETTCTVAVATSSNTVTSARTLFGASISAPGQYMVRVEPCDSAGSTSAENTESNAAVVRAVLWPGDIVLTVQDSGVTGATVKATLILSDR